MKQQYKKEFDEAWDAPKSNKPFYAVLTIVAFWAAAFVLFVSSTTSCRSFKKIADKHPIDAKKWCAENCAPKIEYKPGKTIYKHGKSDTVHEKGKTVYVDCPTNTTKVVRVAAKCPPTKTIYVRDTLWQVDTAAITNTAAIDTLKDRIGVLTTERNDALKSALSNVKSAIWGWSLFCGLCIVLLAYVVYKFIRSTYLRK